MPRAFTPVIPTVLLALLLAAPSPAPAQVTAAEKPLTLDALMGNPGRWFPLGRLLPGLAWCPDGRAFTHLQRSKAGYVLARIPVSAEGRPGKPEVVLSANDLSRMLEAAGGPKVGPAALLRLEWVAPARLRLEEGGALWHVELKTGTARRVRALPEKAEEVTWAPADVQVAWVQDHDLWVGGRDGVARRVTSDGSADLLYGQAVSRREFGITNGLFWAPDGERLAFFREDQRVIEPYPYVDFGPTPARRRHGRYPMAGRAGSRVRVGVHVPGREEPVWLATDPAVDEYLTCITWHPDGRHLYVTHVNRDQDHAALRVYDTDDGTCKRTLFEEKDAEWIEPEEGPIFTPSGSGDFLWFSFRSGYRHLHHFDAEGKHLRDLTPGRFDVLSHDGWATDGRAFFYHATGPDPRQRHLFRATLAGEVRRLTEEAGHHEALLAPGGGAFLDQHSRLTDPGAIELVRLGEELVRTELAEAPHPGRGFAMPRARLFEARNDRGETLHGHLILPPKEGSEKGAPVLQYVYGGPHSQLVQDRWLGSPSRWSLWLTGMAAKGYVVVVVDGRGTAHRGIEWQQQVFRQLGTLELKDQLAGLDKALEITGADPKRVGVTGWSYGGFMTLTMMTRGEGRYVAGVAGAPVTDWSYYETGYGERYMDTPEQNPKGYERSNPANHVKGLKGRLLVVHGLDDDTVMFQSTVAFVQACIDAGVQVETMIYPGQKHGLRGKSFSHFLAKATAFFDAELKR